MNGRDYGTVSQESELTEEQLAERKKREKKREKRRKKREERLKR